MTKFVMAPRETVVSIFYIDGDRRRAAAARAACRQRADRGNRLRIARAGEVGAQSVARRAQRYLSPPESDRGARHALVQVELSLQLNHDERV